jgi:hypothetical protein
MSGVASSVGCASSGFRLRDHGVWTTADAPTPCRRSTGPSGTSTIAVINSVPDELGECQKTSPTVRKADPLPPPTFPAPVWCSVLHFIRRFYRSGARARSLTEVVAAGIKKLESVEADRDRSPSGCGDQQHDLLAAEVRVRDEGALDGAGSTAEVGIVEEPAGD